MGLALNGNKYEVVLDEINNYDSIQIPYEQLVVQLIRERYSLDEELAIQRQRDTKITEFQEYFNYCEECKIRAKEIIGGVE